MTGQPTQPAPFAAAYIVDGRNVCANTTARCEPCQFGLCPGGNHTWAGKDDIIHALRTGQPDPATQKCGCDCVDEPERADTGPDLDDIDEVTFSDLEPCPICSSHGPCGYDAEGLPMVHTDAFDEDTDGDQVYRPIEDVSTGGVL
jgi:hypothetical protein